jgi:hypothetical protein
MGENNLLYHNRFLGNTVQAIDETPGSNQWDNGYPVGGNYWSDFDEPVEGAFDDFQGADQDVLGSDGIVDNGTIGGGGKNPYIIDPDSQDNYPLIDTVDHTTVLFKGWNLISIPFIQPDTDLEVVLSSLSGHYKAVAWRDGQKEPKPWKRYHVNKPKDLNDLTQIDHTMGFWILITKKNGIMFQNPGSPPAVNQFINIYEGWNMVGYPSLTRHNRDEGLNNLVIGTDINVIQWYEASTNQWHFMGPDDSFIPGRGYWVHSMVETNWEVPL